MIIVRVSASDQLHFSRPSSRGERQVGVVFAGGSSRKGVRVPIGVLGGGVWGRFQGGGGGWLPVEGKGEGGVEGGRVGRGQAKEPANQRARPCPNYPLANYPLGESFLGFQTMVF